MAYITRNNGWLRIAFYYRGELCREQLGLKDDPKNRTAAEKIKKSIERDIRAGTFDYAARFPNSKNLVRFGLIKEPEKPSITLGEFAKAWLDENIARAESKQIKPATLKDYRHVLQTHVVRHEIAKLAVNRVSDRDINAFLADVSAKNGRAGTLSKRRLNAIRKKLVALFKLAERRGLIRPEQNPMPFVGQIRVPRPDVFPMNIEEAHHLISMTKGEERLLLKLLIFAGLRPGEAVVLEWADIDWRRKKLWVRRTASWSPKFCIQEVKTGRSHAVDLLDFVLDELQQHRKVAPADERLVFFGHGGNGIWNWNDWQKSRWRNLLREAKIAQRTGYQCRHTFAVLRLEAGDSVQYVADQLGHTTIEQVVNTYARWIETPISRGASTLAARVATLDALDDTRASADAGLPVISGTTSLGLN